MQPPVFSQYTAMADQENLVDQETDIDNNDVVGHGRASWITYDARWDLHAIMAGRRLFLHPIYGA